VRNLTDYGAFVELEEGIDGLLHVSDMVWNRPMGKPKDLLVKGQEIECRYFDATWSHGFGWSCFM
jgi:small subunit ribosomal protein S1